MTSTTIPETAPALVHDPKTGRLALQSLPVPVASPAAGEHLIRVRAVALTNGELGWPEPQGVQPGPPIPGYEVAGTVVSAPAGSAFLAGAEVYARTGFDRQGSARPFSIALGIELGHKPVNLSSEEAATVPLSALTAWQALFVHGGLAAPQNKKEGEEEDEEGEEEGDRDGNGAKSVLITAASGGVGLWAVQLARLTGVGRIVATCGPANADFVVGLGAHEVLDYNEVADLSTWKEKFDLVLDGVGGKTLEQAWTRAADGGTVICIVLPADLKRPASGVGMDVKSVWFIVKADGGQLDRITRLIEAGKARAALDSAFALEEYAEAFAKAQSGHVRGKVVLKLA